MNTSATPFAYEQDLTVHVSCTVKFPADFRARTAAILDNKLNSI